MPQASKKQKLYCYVDETGQDAASQSFVVVAVVSDQNQDELRKLLLEIEQETGTAGFKWHKTSRKRKLEYIKQVTTAGLGTGELFFASYQKPIPYFFPMLEVVEQALKAKAQAPYTARVYVDGIDQRKASELTNALRQRGVSLEMVRSRRDESEPLIRLADMWAGCIRAALLGSSEEKQLLTRAIKANHIRDIKKENTP